MGGTKRIVSTLLAAAVALSWLVGSVDAGAGGARAQSPSWHAPSRIEVAGDRLKRFDAAPFLRALQATRWRRAGQGFDVVVRGNSWRAAAIRLRSTARTQTATTTRGYDEALVAAINDVRARHGLVALRRSDQLEAAAELHSRNMGRRGVFEHESAGGTPFWKRVEQFYASRGFGYWAVGENLVWGAPELSVDQAIQGWMNSPAHRANMLSREWREVGLASVRVESAPGVYGGRTVTIVTCDFGVRR